MARLTEPYKIVLTEYKLTSISLLCRVIWVSASARYAWSKKPVKTYPDHLAVRIRLKALFAASRENAGRRRWVKKLREKASKGKSYACKLVNLQENDLSALTKGDLPVVLSEFS
uniref:hypothetical protein n=1 Tax=Scandinavium goeteborgense TaxID=1851514 RepID=UPI001358B6F8|nr:hypothetical protein [Scandinavium goeteborgense]